MGFLYNRVLLVLIAVSTCFLAETSRAVVSYTGSPYSQDFNSLPTSESPLTWENDATLPGWSLFRQPAPGTAITSVNIGAGTSNAGAFYVLHSGDGDQALGGVGSSNAASWGGASTGSAAGWIALALTNSTGSTIDSFTLTYDGEQWRDGGVSGMATPAAQTMLLEYGLGSTFETVATWNLAGTPFDFVSPVFTGTAGALDGNAAANRVAGLGGLISGVAWNAGENLWVRWVETNDFGADHALAVDNVMFSTGPVVSPGGDFDNDGDVDGHDFLEWQRGNSLPGGPLSASDLGDWKNAYGNTLVAAVDAVPEPATLILIGLVLVPFAVGRRN